jgi:hypothetical protein
MDIKIKTDAEDVSKAIKSAAGRQVRFALNKTLNDLAFMAKADHKKYVNKVFDRPTKWTENATEVLKSSTAAKSSRRMKAIVQLKATAFKSVGATQYLKAQAIGGKRADKRSEKMLIDKGILPQGMQTLVMPKYQDRHGNIRGSLMVKILSYLRAFSEQGYNMNRAYVPSGKNGVTKAALRAAARTEAAMAKNDDTYFVLYNTRLKGHRRRSTNRLPIGIFKRLGRKSKRNPLGNIEPVLMFIPRPTYTKRYDLVDQVETTIRKNYLSRWQSNYAKALATMKYAKGRAKVRV